MTFGNILSLMDNFTADSVQSLKLNRFANNKLGVNKYQSLANWMGCIRHVRNACGHHNRLFNRNLSAPTGIKRVLSRDISLVRTNPQHGTRQTDQVNRIYTNHSLKASTKSTVSGNMMIYSLSLSLQLTRYFYSFQA